MRKIVLITLVILVMTSIFAFATGIPIYKFVTPGGWTEETNSTIAAATATGSWNTEGYIILPATPDYYQLPGQITWNVKISQWIYISIQYLDYNIHADLPGKYMLDDLSIHVVSNGNTYVYFATGGNLSDGSNTMPTYLAAFLSGALRPGAPWTGDWVPIGSLPTQATYMTAPTGLTGGHNGDQTFSVWFGFDVGQTQPKGEYSTYVDMYIQSDP